MALATAPHEDPLGATADEVTVDLVLAAHSSLAPRRLSDIEVLEWCAAPIGGEPLCRRILETTLGLTVGRLSVTSTGDGPLLAESMRRTPAYGLEPHDLPLSRASFLKSFGDRPVLILPRDGLCGFTGKTLARFVSESPGEILAIPLVPNRRAERGVILLPRGIRPSHELLADPSVTEASRFANAAGLGLRLLPAGRWTSVDSPETLRSVARAAADEGFDGMRPWGRRREGVLLGPGARLDRRVRAIGSSAIGARGFVSSGSVLGEGAILGEDVYVGRDASVFDSLVMNGCRIRAGETLRNCVRTSRRDLS